jgi:hypothetical protein
VERLGPLTLIEFKGPTDSLRTGDFQTFLAYMLLYRSQNYPLFDPGQMHLVVIAPSLTKAYRDEIRKLGLTEQLDEAGIWSVRGGVLGHPFWVLETNVLAGLTHPLLTLVSPQLLEKQSVVYDDLQGAGYDDLMQYVVQQVVQFRSQGKEFAMQHLGADNEMLQVWKDILKKLPADDLLEMLTVEDRLKGLPAEDLVRGMEPAELERLRQLLQAPRKQDGV